MTILTSFLILIAYLGSGIILARTLGPTGRGILTAVMLFGLLLASIGGFGVADALVYKSGKAQASSGLSVGLREALWIGVAQSLILCAAGLALVPALIRTPSHPQASLAVLSLAIIPLVFFSQYPVAFLQGQLRILEFNLIRASAPVAYTVGLLVLWDLKAVRVETALVVFLGSTAVECVLALAATVSLSARRTSLVVARELLAYGVKAHAGNFATTLVAQIDLLMLVALVSSQDLGYYAVATSAATASSLIPTAASMVLFPTFANQPADAVPRALSRFLLWGLGGTVLLIPALVVAVPWAVVPVYGRSFTAAVPITLVLVPGYLLRGASQMLVAILRGLGVPMLASAAQIIGLIVLAILLLIGIPSLGVRGAAFAVTSSAAVTFGWLLTIAVRRGRLSSQYVFMVWRSDLSRLRHSAAHARRPADALDTTRPS